MQLGFVGTGTMGNPMVRCLLEAGHALTVYDIRREATANLCAQGAHWADTPRAVAQASEVVFRSYSTPPSVLILTGPARGMAPCLPPGRVLAAESYKNAAKLLRARLYLASA